MLDTNPTVILERVLWIEILALVGYALMCTLSLLLIVYLRVNRREAFKGNLHASRKVILPAFEPLLWILAVVSGIYVVFFTVALRISLYTIGIPNLDRELFYCGRMFVFVLVLVFLRQKSVSLLSLRCAVLKTLVLSSYTLPVIWLFTLFAPLRLRLIFFVKLVGRPLLLIFVVYTCMLRPPTGRANRKALRTHGWFIVVYHVFLVGYSVAQYYVPNSIVYPLLGYTILLWSSTCPLVIWRLLAADTEYWRGMGRRVCSLQEVVPPSSHLHTVSEGISSHGLHVLIEMHRKFLIDFAHLELKRKIGYGSEHVAMFSGLLRSTKAVAIKVYTPTHFTEEVVCEFSHEAALCVSLSHPNIVQFYGMCVCPPTVCLVTELCHHTLEDVLLTRNPPLFNQWIQLNVAYMLDCSRAVAYIHSFSPPVLHRDIKPANFHLDGDNTLKLNDFSDSRRLPSEIPANTVIPKVSGRLQPKMTVTGTVEYMAPEMIDSSTGLAAYAEAADVYSLAITFWDMLYPYREKYPGADNHYLVFTSVLRGYRPPIEENEMDESVPQRLVQLITSAWRSDPRTRPTAHQLVLELEKIQEELLATLAQELNEFEDCETTDKVFTGEHAVVRMEQLDVVQDKSEAVRLGRALMDAGFLHHLEHSCGFQNNTNQYFFDEDNINFCQPLAILEESTSASQNSEGFPFASPSFQYFSGSVKAGPPKRSMLSHFTSTFSGTGETMSSGYQSGRCGCRSLGQLQEIPVTPSSGRSRRSRLRQTFTRSSNSRSSNRGISFSASTPRKWRIRGKTELEDSLRSKLLHEEQVHIIDFVSEGAQL